MLNEILFVLLVLVVAVLMAVDLARTRGESSHGHADRQAHGAAPAVAAAPSNVSAARTFSPEPARAVPTVPAPVKGLPPREAEPIPAFDQVHREMTPASEAELREKLNAIFVNLSRRSQYLVERQLRLIEALEHGEQDVQRRANLSKLNRIAMRMHRNSQNLLVMAGHQSSSGWNQTVTLANLVNVAAAEVEDNERVSSDVEPGIAVRGPAVNDLVHLLVELIENATSFSAAEMPVHIKGHILTSGGALVDIADQGIGMTAKEMAYANQQLDHPPAADADVPRWMGLLVVARLAARHRIRVRLNQAESGGLTALVWLPDEILTHYAVPAGPGRADPRRAAASTAPLASVWTSMPDMLAARPDPAWSARGAQATLQAEPPAPAARRSVSEEHGALNGGAALAMPQVDSQPITHGPPIYDEVESHWPRGREAPGSPSPVTVPGPVTARGSVPPRGPVPSAAPVTAPGPVPSAGPSAAPGPVTTPSPVAGSGTAAAPGPVTASGPPASGPPAPGPPAPGPPASGPPASGPPASGPPASGPPAPSPAAASGPVGGPVPSAASGPAAPALPKRPQPATADPRAAQGPPPGAPNRPGTPGRDPRTGRLRGGSPGWAGPADEANPEAPDEP